jgi:GTP-binding protein HflX
LDERALLVALRLNGAPAEEIEYSLEELKMLVITAGGVVVDSIVIRRDALDPSTIVGKGQLERILLMAGTARTKLIVFDLNNIKPAQVRNLEDHLKCRVIGRTEVILDIFAKRARSSESRIQVELAQLNYLLPRLKGLGGVLSRLGGGIGTRGPVKKCLKQTAVTILRRIHVLKDKLKRIDRHRDVTRKARSKEFRGAVVATLTPANPPSLTFSRKMIYLLKTVSLQPWIRIPVRFILKTESMSSSPIQSVLYEISRPISYSRSNPHSRRSKTLISFSM